MSEEGGHGFLPPGGIPQLALGFIPGLKGLTKGVAVMGSFADPGAHTSQYGQSRRKILGQPMPQPQMVRQAAAKAAKIRIEGKDGRPTKIKNLSVKNLRNYSSGGGVGADSDRKYLREIFKSLSGELKQKREGEGQLKAAGIFSSLGRAIRPAVVEGGPRTLSPFIKLPLVTAGLGAGTYAAFSGLDYLHDQSRVIGRARAYSNMMKEYGSAITLATYRGLGQDAEHPLVQDPSVFKDFVEDKSRQVFKALYKVAPEIAKEPTLAAGHMSSVMFEMGSRMGDTPFRDMNPEEMREGVALPLTEFAEPAQMERTMGRQVVRPSDVLRGATGMLSAYQNFSPLARAHDSQMRARGVGLDEMSKARAKQQIDAEAAERSAPAVGAGLRARRFLQGIIGYRPDRNSPDAAEQYVEGLTR